MEKRVTQSAVLRKRGRPFGRNRVPLSLDERRARNAQYERERRKEMADVIADLAAAAGCNGSISTPDLLGTVITQLQQASQIRHSSDLDSLRRCNKNLTAQTIESLEQQLAVSDDGSPVQHKEDLDDPRQFKRKREDFEFVDAGHLPVPDHSPPERKLKPDPEQFSPQARSLQHQSSEPSPDGLEKHHLVPEMKFTPVTQFEPQPKYLPEEGFQPEDPWLLPFLPIPTVSPLSDSSDPPQSQTAVDYSAYHFASARLPTPEIQIPVEGTEFLGPVQYSEQVYQLTSPHRGPSMPGDDFPPLQYTVPELHYAPLIRSGPSSSSSGDTCSSPQNESQLHYGAPMNVCQGPVQTDATGSVGILSVPESSSLRNVGDAAEVLMFSENFIAPFYD